MNELAPDALLLNYVNPMAANCWAFDRVQELIVEAALTGNVEAQSLMR